MMEGILLIISSTRMSHVSVDHAIRICRIEKKPLYVAFILDSELADSIFDKMTMEGFIGDKPGEKIYDAVLDEYELRGRKRLEEIQKKAKANEIESTALFQKGNFLQICCDLISSKGINHVVITRRKRSNLSRFIFGSVIDDLMDEFPDVNFEVFEEG